jgi:MATE family multidrug resistance protein
MQDSVSAMICDIVVNGMNILMSILLASLMGFAGIAAGTVIAQWTGLVTALGLIAFKYRRDTMSLLRKEDVRGLFKGSETRQFFVMNTDLFVRSLCFIAIYIGFTVISARYGDLLLAVSSVIMKLLMIFSYFTDGFAYAGEALTGRYIGARDGVMVRQTVRWTFIWSMGLAFLFMLIYQFAGVPMVRVMTSDVSVIEMSREYLPWLLLMPVVGCAAFTWDGIYVGATASRKMRDSMLWAVVAFVVVWAAGIVTLNLTMGDGAEASLYNKAAMHVLMAAYFAHLLARTVYLTVHRRCVII